MPNFNHDNAIRGAAPINSLRALEVLYDAEGCLSIKFTRVVSLLEADSRVGTLLLENQKRPGGDRFNRLWQVSAKIAARFIIERRDTDWVFENFWENPHEREHSKLLAYFLDPQEDHGRFLLPELLSLLEKAAKESRDRNWKAEPRFVAAGCTVNAESGGYIDLRIERESDDSRFAIIIENKVNNAPDQYGFRVSIGREASQLETYVERMRLRRFKDHEIYVFYLPLTGDRYAKREDVNAITRGGSGVTYARITFKDHILVWLATAMKDLPAGLNQDIGEHLRYYARLITYLVNKNKQIEMDSEILESIKQEEQERGHLSLSAIDAAIESACSLKRVFERVLRARLLRRIHADLCKSNLKPNYYVFEWTPIPRVIRARAEPESDYADEFVNQIVVGVQGNEASVVGFGWDGEGRFYFAYLRLRDEQGQFDETVQREARSFLGENITVCADGPFYVYKYEAVTPKQCEEEEAATNHAVRVCEMSKSLQKALG